MTLRDQRQLEFSQIFERTGKRGILNLCPRFGKIRTSILILEKYNNPKVLIAYPDNNIKDSWKRDFETMNYDDSNVTYTTHLSLKKLVTEIYDIVIIDEIHLLSTSQVLACQKLFIKNNCILGLTGTLTSQTESYLKRSLKLRVVAKYSIQKAIDEKVISDYRIKIISTELDAKTIKLYSGKAKTEKAYYDNVSYVIKKLTEEGKDTKFLKLKRKSILQNSPCKVIEAKKLLKQLGDKRALVFCGRTEIADSLGIPSFHNKTKDKTIFQEFCEGIGNHLAVVKIGNTGTTYKPLNCVILADFDSNGENFTQKINRCMAYEYDNPEKLAIIYIISTKEEVEVNWLRKSLEFFDKNKIEFL